MMMQMMHLSQFYWASDFTKLGWRNVNFFILRAVSYSLAPCVAGSAKRHVLGRHFPTLQRPQSPNGDSEAPPNAESSTIGQNAVEKLAGAVRRLRSYDRGRAGIRCAARLEVRCLVINS
jgi:hypothetical protein